MFVNLERYLPLAVMNLVFVGFVLVGHEYLSGVLGNQEERTTVNEGTKQIDGHT